MNFVTFLRTLNAVHFFAATFGEQSVFTFQKIASRCPRPGAATGSVLLEKVFLEIQQHLQENTCARVPFLIKPQVCSFIKKETGTGVFLSILQNF